MLLESLERRDLLTAISPTIFTDELDGDTSSIGALIASPGGNGISLREAVVAANHTSGADVINLSLGTYVLTRSGSFEDAGLTGDIDVTDSLSILGISGGTTIDASGSGDRVLDVISGAFTVTLAGLTISGGSTPSTINSAQYSAGEGNGGGVRASFNNILNVVDCVISDNHADSLFGSARTSGGGGIMSNASNTILRTTFENNYAANFGGGFGNNTSYSRSSVNIFESTFVGNDSRNGGAVQSARPITIEASTFTQNGSSGSGQGGAISAHNGTLILNNSTLSDNSAQYGGAIYGFGTVVINQSTFVDNSADRGGAIFTASSPAVVTISNSILASNTASTTGPDVSGAIVSGGYNLLGDTSGSTGFGVAGDVLGVAPMLGPLADNGGSTRTHAFLPGSPALDAANPTSALAYDQRGYERQLSAPDIGAYELVVLENLAPIALDDQAELDEDTTTAINVLANDSDPDDHSLSVAISTFPIRGTIAINSDKTIQYTPFPNENGVDSFVYQINDGHGGGAVATVSVSTLAVNDPPVANPDAVNAVDSIATDINVLANDDDFDGDALTIAAVTQPTHGTTSVNPDGTIRYTSAAGFVGGDSFTYFASDGQAISTFATVSVLVTGPPQAQDDHFTVASGGELRFFAPGENRLVLNSSAGDWVGQGRTYDYSDTNSNFTATRLNNYVLDEFAYIGVDNFAGSDDFFLTFAGPDHTVLTTGSYVGVSRFPFNTTGPGLSVTATGRSCNQLTGSFDITRLDRNFNDELVRFDASLIQSCVGGAVDPPLTGTISYADNSRLTASLLDNDLDPDGDPITASLIAGPQHGTLTLYSDGGLKYLADSGFVGDDIFIYQATDGSGLTSQPATVTISVTATNDVPVVTAITALDPVHSNAASVRYEVQFSEPVNVNPTQWLLTTSGVTGAVITGSEFSGDRSRWIVTIQTGSGDGTLQLHVNDTDRITDMSGRPLGGNGSGNGSFNSAASYTLERNPQRSIAGNVYSDTNGNRIPDASDVSVAGLRVYLDGNGDGVWNTGETFVFSANDIAGTPTDETGDYRFDDLPLGNYTVRVESTTGWLASDVSVASVTLEFASLGDTITPLGVEENLTAIRGVVIEDVNSNGNNDAGEIRIAGVTVYLDRNLNGVLDSGEPSQLTRDDDPNTGSDEQGTFDFEQVALGTSRVRFVIPPGFVATGPTSADVDIASRTTVVSDVQFLMFKNVGTITGREYEDANGNDVFDGEDSPLSGVQVFVDLNLNEWPDPGEPIATTAADGTYSIPEVAEGSYIVRPVVPTHFRATDAYPTSDRLFGSTWMQADNTMRLNEIDPITGAVIRSNLTTIPRHGASEIAFDGKQILWFDSISDMAYELAPDGTVLDQQPLGEQLPTGGYENVMDYGPVVVGGVVFSLRGSGIDLSLYRFDPHANQFTYQRPITYNWNLTSLPAQGNPLFPTPDYSSSVSADGKSIVLGTTDDRVLTIDPETGIASFSATASTTLPADYSRGAVGGESFVARGNGTVDVFDAGGSLTRTIGANVNYFGLGGGVYRDMGVQVTVAAGQNNANIDHRFASTLSSISGMIVNDANDNQLNDAGDAPRNGTAVYLDTNRNSVLDANEPRVFTDGMGHYTFSDVEPGEYVVRQVPAPSDTVQAWTSNYTRLFTRTTVSSVSTISELDPFTGQILRQFPSPGTVGFQTGLALQDDILYVSQSGVLYAVNANTGAMIDQSPLPMGQLDGLAVIGSKAYVLQSTNTILIVDLNTRLVEQSLDLVAANPSMAGSLAVQTGLGESADGQNLAAHDGNNIRIIDPSTGEILETLAGTYPGNALAGAGGETFEQGLFLSGTQRSTDARDHLGLVHRRFAFPFNGPTVNGYAADNVQATEHRVRVYEDRNLTGLDFGNVQLVGSISGTQFFDANENSILDVDDMRLPGRTIYVDINGNGAFDAGEPSAISQNDDINTPENESGHYVIDQVPRGQHDVRQVLPGGWEQTLPIPAPPAASLAAVNNYRPGINTSFYARYDSELSQDGRYVVFSTDVQLLPIDTNNIYDIYVLDRNTDQLDFVSLTEAGGLTNDFNFNPAISGDGRFVAFQSFGSNLTEKDSNGNADVFLRDRFLGTTVLVSRSLDVPGRNSFTGNSYSYRPHFSGDGRFLSFWSNASNIIAGDTNGVFDLFCYTLASGDMERISKGFDGSEAIGGNTNHGSMSYDGRFISFQSDATNLVPNDTNGQTDIFVYDRESGLIERVSTTSEGEQSTDDSYDATISDDGRYVVFKSRSGNFTGSPEPTSDQIFRKDRTTGELLLVSADQDGSFSSNNYASQPSISGDGRWIVYDSPSGNIVSGDNNGLRDVFLYDAFTATTQVVSRDASGAVGTGTSEYPALSQDGTTITFLSNSYNFANHLLGGLYEFENPTITSVTPANRVTVASAETTTDVDFASQLVNAAPTDIVLSTDSINENVSTSAADFLFASLSAIDPDVDDSHTFDLVPGNGDADNSHFVIVGNELRVKQGETLDHEIQPSYLVRIRTTDSNGLTLEKPVTLQVNNLIEINKSDVNINGGDAQRSRVDTVTIDFDTDVILQEGAITITKRGEGSGVVGMLVSPLPGIAARSFTLSFAGEFVEYGSLVNGNYQLTVDATKIVSSAGQGLDTNQDGIAGDDFVFGDVASDKFFCLYGDSDGDRDVDALDYLRFVRSYKKPADHVDYHSYFDQVQDGDLDSFDLLKFRRSYKVPLFF